MTSCVTSINYMNPNAIARSYPTMLYYHEEDTFDGCDHRGPRTIIYTLYVVYFAGKKRMVDIYCREKIRGNTVDDPYGFDITKTLADTLVVLNRYNQPYAVLSRVYGNGFICDNHDRFRKWLGKARERIVKREMHPDRIQTLLESGVDLDDIESVIESKLAGKLSW